LLIPSLNRLSLRANLGTVAQGDGIPRISHQTIYTHDLPAILQADVNQLQRLDLDWDYRFHDDNDIATFVQSNLPVTGVALL